MGKYRPWTPDEGIEDRDQRAIPVLSIMKGVEHMIGELMLLELLDRKSRPTLTTCSMSDSCWRTLESSRLYRE